MSTIFEKKTLHPFEVEELQSRLNIYLPKFEQQALINADKSADAPDYWVSRSERKNKLVQLFASLCLFAVLTVAAPSVCEANNPMPIPDPNDDYMYGRGGSESWLSQVLFLLSWGAVVGGIAVGISTDAKVGWIMIGLGMLAVGVFT